MPRTPRRLPAQNTLSYLLLTLTALCGEYPISQISRLPGGPAYLESMVTSLRQSGLLHTFSKDGLRGLRLTSPAKRLLLADAPQWFSDYLTGSSEPNKLKSELSRRLRLHRMAEILTIMHNADIPAFPWEKAPFSAMVGQNAESPAYYTSREIKEIGPQGTKIRGSRATGILLTDDGVFLTYNTAKAQMKWEYKAELRFKALLQTGWVMPDTEISGIVFGSAMEQLPILMQPDAHSYFLLDGSFPHFYYLTNDRYNEIDLELPGKQPCAYYCITSDQDSTFDFLSSLFLSFVFIRLVRYADEHCPGGVLPVPVHVLGEELCACGVIPDLSRKISVIRSRNLSMSCVFQNLAGLQNRYPYNQWQEILGNCDVQLFLGCTDALTAEFISDRTGEVSISVTSKAKQLGTWRVSNYTPEYRETSGVGRRKLMTMDEVLRMDVDKALIIIRGKNVLEVDKYDYSKHPEAKKLRPSKAASHIPAWQTRKPQKKQASPAPPSQAAEKKPAQKKKPASTEKVVTVTKESIMKKKEGT